MAKRFALVKDPLLYTIMMIGFLILASGVFSLWYTWNLETNLEFKIVEKPGSNRICLGEGDLGIEVWARYEDTDIYYITTGVYEPESNRLIVNTVSNPSGLVPVIRFKGDEASVRPQVPPNLPVGLYEYRAAIRAIHGERTEVVRYDFVVGDCEEEKRE